METEETQQSRCPQETWWDYVRGMSGVRRRLGGIMSGDMSVNFSIQIIRG